MSYCKYFVLFLLILSACSGPKKENTSDEALNVLPINIDESKTYAFHEIVDTSKTEFIQLETTKESLLGNYINRVYAADNMFFFISDGRFIVFSKTGEHLFTLSETGRGPGEFQSITDARLFNDHFHLLDRKQNKILKYSKDGTFLSSFNYEAVPAPWSFYILDSDHYCFYSMSYISEQSRHRVNLYSRSEQSIIAKKDSITDKEVKWQYIMESNDFTKRGETALLNYAFNDTIYRITKSSIESHAVFNFGKYTLPQNVREQDYKDIQDFYQKNHKQYIYSPLGIVSSKKHLCSGILFNDKYYQIIHNWKTDETLIIDEIENIFNSTGSQEMRSMFLPKASDDEFHYMLLRHYLIEDMVSGPELPEILKNTNENKNPIVVKIKYEF